MTDISSQWTRSIVFDVDDTISTHWDGDYRNAAPNVRMIDKINDLHARGFRIILLTARGQLSCNGDVDLIERTKRPTLERWLHEHGVRYHELRFGKPLALYYVDDRALRPEEFLDTVVETLEGGSGAIVERWGDRVIKTCRNARSQAAWYRDAAPHVHTPRVHSVVGDTLTIDYIEGTSAYDVAGPELIAATISDIETLRALPSSARFDTYIARIEEHVALNPVKHQGEILSMLHDWAGVLDEHRSFCHGDMTLENIIFDGSAPWYIDPNRPEGVYSSYLLDYGKLYQSLHYDYEAMFMKARPNPSVGAAYRALRNALVERGLHRLVLLIELTHYIRMLKYKSPQQRGRVHEIISQLYGEIVNAAD